MSNLKPLFRWAGAKTKMRKKYGENFWPDQSFKRFVEPFFGTGCVSMWIYERFPETEFIVNDYNDDLINIYQSIKNNYEEFKSYVDEYESEYLSKDYDNRKTYFMDTRHYHGWEYDNIPTVERAGILFGLLKTSFNGIWQLNKNTNGKFGTPVGLRNEKDTIYNRDNLLAFHHFSQNVLFHSGDFEKLDKYATKDSFLYLDPPYRDCHTEYSKEGFDDNDQIRMIGMMNRANTNGALVSMSNKYHFDNFFEDRLSNEYNLLTYGVKYTAGRTDTNPVTECLFRNYESTKTQYLTSFFLN